MKNSKALWMLTVALGISSSAFAESDQKVRFADVAELSGAGATVGTNWKNGIDLAVAEINAKGGILGRRSRSPTTTPRPTRASPAAQVQKALDDQALCHRSGPVFSGSIKVTCSSRSRPACRRSWAARPPT